MNKQFIEEILMANKHMKSSSFLLVFRKMKNETKIGVYFFHNFGKKIKKD